MSDYERGRADGQREMREAAVKKCKEVLEQYRGTNRGRCAEAVGDHCADEIRALQITEQPAQEPISMRYADQDVFAVAHRLALELECLLLDTKDTVSVSKWWDSAHEALEQWRQYANVATPNLAAEVERLTAELSAARHSEQVAYENFAVMTDQRDTLLVQRDGMLAALQDISGLSKANPTDPVLCANLAHQIAARAIASVTEGGAE